MGEPQGVGGFPFVVYQSLLWFCGCDSTGQDSVEGLIVSVTVYLVSAYSSIIWLPLPGEELLAWELVMIETAAMGFKDPGFCPHTVLA